MTNIKDKSTYEREHTHTYENHSSLFRLRTRVYKIANEKK